MSDDETIAEPETPTARELKAKRKPKRAPRKRKQQDGPAGVEVTDDSTPKTNLPRRKAKPKAKKRVYKMKANIPPVRFTDIPPEEAAHAADPEKGLPADVNLDDVDTAPGRFEMQGRHGGNLYHPSFIPLAEKYFTEGARVLDFARAIGVSIQTIRNWRFRYPAFNQACCAGMERADQQVENAVFQTAIGYDYPAIKFMTRSLGEGCSEVVQIPYNEHVPPSIPAAIFWLKNRAPKRWRDKIDHEHVEKPALPPIDLNKLNDREQGALLLLLEKASPDEPDDA